MLQPNLRDNNNFTHLVRELSEGLPRGEDASKIYTLKTYPYYGLSPRKQDKYNLFMAQPIIKGGSTLENLHDLSQYKSKLKQPNQQRNSQDNSPLIVPGESIYDGRPYNSNNSTNGSKN